VTRKKQPYKARLDRWDIYNNLPSGGQVHLARQFSLSKSHIGLVLQGRRKDLHGIIKAAELLAAVNIWKTRFCKVTESQL
jgi:hypothetical protein